MPLLMNTYLIHWFTRYFLIKVYSARLWGHNACQIRFLSSWSLSLGGSTQQVKKIEQTKNCSYGKCHKREINGPNKGDLN